jgi:hypothetical protein
MAVRAERKSTEQRRVRLRRASLDETPTAAAAQPHGGGLASDKWLRDMRDVHSQIEAEIASLRETMAAAAGQQPAPGAPQ